MSHLREFGTFLVISARKAHLGFCSECELRSQDAHQGKNGGPGLDHKDLPTEVWSCHGQKHNALKTKEDYWKIAV